MAGITRTPSVSQSQFPSTKDSVNTPVELPEEAVDEAPEESLPSAFEAVSDSSLGSPSASISYAAISSSQKPSLASPQTSISSPFSSREYPSSRGQHCNIETSPLSTALSTSSSFRLQKHGSLESTHSPLTLPQEDMLPPLPLSATRDIRKSSIRETPPSRQADTPHLTPTDINPRTQVQEDRLDRQYTISSVSNQPATFDTSAGDGVVADAALAESMYLNAVDIGARKHSSASSSTNPRIDQRTNSAQKSQPATNQQSNPSLSNNPWKDLMATDEAYAKSLQQEEYRDLQMERDLLLAYSIINGAADDGDIELAYFLSRETATLIASTDAVTANPYTPEALASATVDPRDFDRESQQIQLDWLEAQIFETEFRARDTANEASISVAKKLQAEFDNQALDEEAWEDWKKNNIEECIVCGDEQHREELLWPCEHGYCDTCLQDGFKNALTSKTPLKCCNKALDINDCFNLPAEFVTAYGEMMLELSTPNPMYCCNVQCAKFLPPRSIVGDVGTCEKCGRQTCRHCRRQTHPGAFCKEDKETEAVKNLAKAKGWKTCPGCNHLIERFTGCLHIVCSRCQTAFCYRCSKPWNLCESTCPDRQFPPSPQKKKKKKNSLIDGIFLIAYTFESSNISSSLKRMIRSSNRVVSGLCHASAFLSLHSGCCGRRRGHVSLCQPSSDTDDIRAPERLANKHGRSAA
jgi:E3 ubiquitin-protein ligase RNF144